MTTGERIKAARKAMNMTQQELAAKLNIPFQSISQWERDKRKPKFCTIEKIASALQCDALKLFWGEEADSFFVDQGQKNDVHRNELANAHKKYEKYYGKAPLSLSDVEDYREDDRYLNALYELHEAFDKLNPTGQIEAIKRVKDLTYNPDYLLEDENAN